MLIRFLFAVMFCLVGFFIYVLSIAFDENLSFPKRSFEYYLLIGKEIDSLPLPDEHLELYYSSFPGDGPSQPYEEAVFLLPSNKIDATIKMYEDYLLGQSCRHSTNETIKELISISWRCKTGKYEFSANPNIMRNKSGEYLKTDKRVVRVAYYSDEL